MAVAQGDVSGSKVAMGGEGVIIPLTATALAEDWCIERNAGHSFLDVAQMRWRTGKSSKGLSYAEGCATGESGAAVGDDGGGGGLERDCRPVAAAEAGATSGVECGKEQDSQKQQLQGEIGEQDVESGEDAKQQRR